MAAERLAATRGWTKDCVERAEKLDRRTLDRAVGSYSLGRTQMAFWLFLVIAGYLYIAMSIGQMFGIMNPALLTLLGISTATGLGSVLINRAAYSRQTTGGYLNDVLSTGSPHTSSASRRWPGPSSSAASSSGSRSASIAFPSSTTRC